MANRKGVMAIIGGGTEATEEEAREASADDGIDVLGKVNPRADR